MVMPCNNDEVYQSLKNDILSIRLKPGQFLSENEMAKAFGVSRTPVHNAFVQLKAENLVNVLPQRGTFVSLLDWDYIQQLIYLRIQLDTAVFTDAVYSLDEALSNQIEENLEDQYAAAMDQDSAARFYTLSDAFHGMFYAAVGKQKLWNTLLSVQYDYMRYRYLLYSDPDGRLNLYQDHLNLFNLVRDKNIAAIHRFVPLHHPIDGEDFPSGLELYRDYFIKN